MSTFYSRSAVQNFSWTLITVMEDKISLQRVTILQLPMKTSRTKQIYLNYLKAFYFMKSTGNILATFTKHKNKHTDLLQLSTYKIHLYITEMAYFNMSFRVVLVTWVFIKLWDWNCQRAYSIYKHTSFMYLWSKCL